MKIITYELDRLREVSIHIPEHPNEDGDVRELMGHLQSVARIAKMTGMVFLQQQEIEGRPVLVTSCQIPDHRDRPREGGHPVAVTEREWEGIWQRASLHLRSLQTTSAGGAL